MSFRYGYKPKSKYGAEKTIVNGISFSSKKEARRYQELLFLQKAGKISGLDLQVKYEIIQEHREPDTIGPRGGRKKGKIIEPARYYVADFVYYDSETETVVVEDCKGFKTDVYRLKKALMYDRYKIRIKET